MTSRRSPASPLGVVIGVCGLMAGAAVFVAGIGVIEAITAAALVVAVGSAGMRLARSRG